MANPSDDNTAASIPGVIRDPQTAANLLRVNADGSINATVGALGAATSGAALPTADPHIVGRLWANSGVVTVSAG